MSVRTDLLKGLTNYAIFVPQLTRPVLRVLIQGNVNMLITSNIKLHCIDSCFFFFQNIL